MSSRENYKPGPARGVEIRKNGDDWTLIVVRELQYPPAKVWQALTDPAQIREWAPYEADRSLGAVGPVTLTTVGIPKPVISQTRVTRADAPALLEYRWGDNEMRWQLEPLGKGTHLTLWHNIDRRYISMGAAGWHICLDVLDRFVSGEPLGRVVGGEAMKFDWGRLHTEYAKLFGIDAPELPPNVPRA
jgi:uncharacterized protein YndB with AHSA1/START domain